MEKDALLKVKDLRVEYHCDAGVVSAVNGISFSLHEGETLGIVGETGAGKTTTALSLMRLLPDKVGTIAGGSIELDGVDLTRAPEHVMNQLRGKELSMIFQDPMTSLNPVMRVEDQIAELLAIHQPKLKRAEVARRVDECLRQVGIDPSRKRDYPHQFSGGMKQRVIVAMSLVCSPRILIADEPTTALDVTIQAQILELMNALKRKNNTAMILITHDLGIVVRMCDKVAVMYAGEFVEFGTVYDLFDETGLHHPYTAGLFRAIPNLEDDVERLEQIEGLLPNPMQLPEGCRFAPRCGYACPECLEKRARHTDLTRSHYVLCDRAGALSGKGEG